jgi:hypothetical protein
MPKFSTPGMGNGLNSARISTSSSTPSGVGSLGPSDKSCSLGERDESFALGSPEVLDVGSSACSGKDFAC